MSKWISKSEEILESLQIPYDFERFTCDDDKLPDTYAVYFLVDDTGASWADGKETAHEPRIQVSLFYRDSKTALIVPEQIENAFISAGFIRAGAGYIPFQPNTGHYGWRCDFRLYERR